MNMALYLLFCSFICLAGVQCDDGLALIMNAKIFHYEVVSFFADHLNALGYKLQLWLAHNTLTTSRLMGKAGLAFLQDYASDFRFLPSSFNSLFTVVDLPRKIKVLIHINADENSDLRQLCRLNIHDTLMQRAEKVIMVVHHAGNVVKLSRLCLPPHCALFVLGEHLYEAAIRYLQLAQIDAEVLHAFGVFRLAPKYEQRTVLYKQQQLKASSQTLSTVASKVSPRYVVIQGSLLLQRRRYPDLFECVQKIISKGFNIKLVLLGKSIKGRELVIPSEIKTHVIKQEDKQYEEFYPIISSADYIVTFANEDFSYMVNRSTSSITIGVVCEVPLAIPYKLLSKYSCLRDQPMHRNVSKEGDCEALIAAVALSDTEVLRMKQEVKYCKQTWLQQGKQTIKSFLDRPVQYAVSNGTVQWKYQKQCRKDKVLRATAS